ncbi:hypothetical protein ACUSIJ_06655 [Pseudochelatococcus sp. B33]
MNEINSFKEDAMDVIERKSHTSSHVHRVPVERDAVLAAFRSRKTPRIAEKTIRKRNDSLRRNEFGNED